MAPYASRICKVGGRLVAFMGKLREDPWTRCLNTTHAVRRTVPQVHAGSLGVNLGVIANTAPLKNRSPQSPARRSIPYEKSLWEEARFVYRAPQTLRAAGAESRENAADLLFGRLDRPRIIKDKIGSLDLFCVGDLGGHATRDFGTGSIFRNTEAACQTLDALFGMARDRDEMVKAVGGPGFQDERGFHNGDGIRIARSNLVHPFVFVGDHGGMHDGIKFLYARRRTRTRFSRRGSQFRFPASLP